MKGLSGKAFKLNRSEGPDLNFQAARVGLESLGDLGLLDLEQRRVLNAVRHLHCLDFGPLRPVVGGYRKDLVRSRNHERIRRAFFRPHAFLAPVFRLLFGQLPFGRQSFVPLLVVFPHLVWLVPRAFERLLFELRKRDLERSLKRRGSGLKFEGREIESDQQLG